MHPSDSADVYHSPRHTPAEQVMYHNPLEDHPQFTVDPSRYFRPKPARRSCISVISGWVSQNRGAAAALAFLLVFVFAWCMALAACSDQGCPAIGIKPRHPRVAQVDEPNQDISRLLVAFTNLTLDALDVIPSVLHQYISQEWIQSSGIQLLSFIDADTLAVARQYLADHKDLDLLVRDFIMSVQLPQVTSPAPRLLAQATAYTIASAATAAAQTPAGANSTLSADTAIASSDTSSIAGTVQPNDPYVRSGEQWFLTRMGVQQAWAAGTGSAEIVVAVIDSGADLTHPDLKPSLWINRGEVPGNGIDDDGNGLIDDVHGWDFAGGCTMSAGVSSCSPMQCKGRAGVSDAGRHGTAVAGLVAAAMNNGLGGAGVAPGVKIMILRVADCSSGTIYASAVAAAMDYALRMGAHIVQTSFGGSYPSGYTPTSPAPWYHAGWTRAYTKAIQPLADKGILVVAAAGNEGVDLDRLNALGYSYCPCLVQLPNVLCVMASEPDDTATEFSNYGTTKVHVAAPGRAILSTLPGGGYEPLHGTSFSAPIVSGSAALALSALGAADGNYYKAVQVRSVLMNSTVAKASLICASSGRVSTVGAVGRALATAAGVPGGLTSLSALLPAPPSLLNTSLGAAAQPDDLLYITAPPAAYLTGFTDYFYRVPAGWGATMPPPAALGAEWPVMDVLPRSQATAYFQSFKYTTGVLLSIESHVLLQQVGVWQVRVVITAPRTAYRVLVNGSPLTLTDKGQAALVATTTGLYFFQFQVMGAIPTFSVKVKPPSVNSNSSSSSADWPLLTGSVSLAATHYRPPGFGPALSPSAHFEAGLLAPGWVLRYNLTRFWPLASQTVTDSLVTSSASSTGLSMALAAKLGLFLTQLVSPSDTGRSSDGVSASVADAPGLKLVKMTTIQDLAFTSPSALQAVLFPEGLAGQEADNAIDALGTGWDDGQGGGTGAGNKGLIGWASTVLRGSSLPRNIIIKVQCRTCMVFINDLPVLAAWEPPAATNLTTTTTSLAARVSGCITLAPQEMHRINVVFASTDAAAAPLAATWAPCGSADRGWFEPFAGQVGSPDLWDITYTTANTGVVPGVQCDLWRDPDLPVAPGSAHLGLVPASVMLGTTNTVSGQGKTSSTTSPTAGSAWFHSMTPQEGALYKARLPEQLCTSAELQPLCSRSFVFTLEDLFPGLSASNSTFNVRCWTYWSGSFQSPSGPRLLPSSDSVPSTVYLAGQQVWSSSWPDAITASSSTLSQPPWASTAPVMSDLSDNLYQLLTVEWLHVAPDTYLAVLDGQSSMQITQAAMKLPIPMAAAAQGSDSIVTSWPVGQVVVGRPGHISAAFQPDMSDVQRVVEANQWGLARLGKADLPSQGLDSTVAYPSVDLQSKVRYTVANGFLRTYLDRAYSYTLSLTDGDASATMVCAGGVTLLNARPYHPNNTLTTSSVNLTLPGVGYVPLSVTIKTGRADGQSLFGVSVGSPGGSSRPVDSSMWFLGVSSALNDEDAGVAAGLGVLR